MTHNESYLEYLRQNNRLETVNKRLEKIQYYIVLFLTLFSFIGLITFLTINYIF